MAKLIVETDCLDKNVISASDVYFLENETPLESVWSQDS